MTVNQRLIRAVTEVVPVCVPTFYAGERSEYAEFDINSHPDWFHDGIPWAVVSDIQLRWYAPPDADVLEREKTLLNALAKADFELQETEDISENLFQGREYSLKYSEMLIDLGSEGS